MLTHSGRTRLGERRFLVQPTFVPGHASDRAAWLRRGLAALVTAAVVATLAFLSTR